MHQSLRIIALTCTLLIAACATTSGREIADEDLAKIEKGRTTENEVLQILGKPESVKTTRDGSVLVYSYAESRSDAASYVPYAGGLFGTTDTEYKVIYIFVGNDHVVKEVQVEEGGSTSGNKL